jgi:hypothetical protein
VDKYTPFRVFIDMNKKIGCNVPSAPAGSKERKMASLIDDIEQRL